MWVIKVDYWETDPKMLTIREGSPWLVTKFLTSFPKIFSSGQQKSHNTELAKVSLMCFSSFAAALSAVSLAVHEDDFEMLGFSSGPASPSAPEIFSSFVPVGISVCCLMRSGYNMVITHLYRTKMPPSWHPTYA